jgi:hypothetical protein
VPAGVGGGAVLVAGALVAVVVCVAVDVDDWARERWRFVGVRARVVRMTVELEAVVVLALVDAVVDEWEVDDPHDATDSTNSSAVTSEST